MKSMWFGMGMVVVAASLGLVSCGGDPATTGTTIVDIGATNFVTIPPVPVTAPPITTAPDAPGSILEFESEYTVVEGDYPSTVASKFKVDFQAFMDLNAFTLVGEGASAVVPEWTGVGQVVKIPAGATVPGEPVVTVATTAAPGTETSEAATEATTATTEAPESVTTTTAAPTGACAPGSYTIEPNDYPGLVAEKFDVSIASLNAANTSTKYYSSFAVGVKIVIPAPSDCAG